MPRITVPLQVPTETIRSNSKNHEDPKSTENFASQGHSLVQILMKFTPKKLQKYATSRNR